MAINRPVLFLVCYDIADPKRLSRVHRYLKSQGLPIQYSVFTAELKKSQLDRLLSGLQSRIHPHEDDVRCYALPAHLDFDLVGRQVFAEGVMLFSATGVNRLLGIGAN